jgi:Tetratricopeptide repeat
VRRAAATLGLALAALAAACGESGAPEANAPAADSVPAALRDCAGCHPKPVREYLEHGMSDSLGPLAEAPTGEWTNAHTGTRFVFGTDAQGPTLTATRADGGRRVQRVVGRIGAGIFDTSFVGTELDPLGRPTGRLSFLPLERLADGTLEPAPFEALGGAGFDQPVTAECLECHTTENPIALTRPSLRADRVYPGNALGADALRRLPPLGCDACHGDTRRHVEIQLGGDAAAADDIGLVRLGELPAPEQRDVCARCHLDGEARVALQPLVGYGPRRHPLHQDRPVLVPAQPDDEFRFVAQLDRLALSACFRGSEMSCTTCHAPHRAVIAQGPQSFEAACRSCHASDACHRPADLTVEAVTGAPSRTAEGCVDCHVRRSQPYDLAGVRTADHWIRSRIPLPSTAPVHAKHSGPLALFDDGRMAAALDSDGGRAWENGLIALGLWHRGDAEEAAHRLDQLPPPGTPAVDWPPPPAPLPPLPLSGSFHFVRGLVLEAVGRVGEAHDAYRDAELADGQAPEPRVNRAALRLGLGDSESARETAEELLNLYPRAEAAFNLGARALAQDGQLEAAADALVKSTLCWPSDAGVWHELGRLYLALGDAGLAQAALSQAAVLEPSRPGLQADLAAAGAR